MGRRLAGVSRSLGCSQGSSSDLGSSCAGWIEFREGSPQYGALAAYGRACLGAAGA